MAEQRRMTKISGVSVTETQVRRLKHSLFEETNITCTFIFGGVSRVAQPLTVGNPMGVILIEAGFVV